MCKELLSANRSYCKFALDVFSSDDGSLPRERRRVGGETLEALTRDRGGGARRSSACAASLGGGSFVDDFKTPGTESQSAIDVLDERFPAASGDTANVVFAVDSGTLREPARRARSSGRSRRSAPSRT